MPVPGPTANVCVALFLALGPSEGTAPAPPEGLIDPFQVVGLCPIESPPRTWSVVWHPGAPGAGAAAERVFRYLESPDFTNCLTLLIESDDAAREAAARLGSDPSADNARATSEARRRWKSYQVDQAILEVATTGARGPAVERVLDSCRQIRDRNGPSSDVPPRSSAAGTAQERLAPPPPRP